MRKLFGLFIVFALLASAAPLAAYADGGIIIEGENYAYAQDPQIDTILNASGGKSFVLKEGRYAEWEANVSQGGWYSVTLRTAGHNQWAKYAQLAVTVEGQEKNATAVAIGGWEDFGDTFVGYFTLSAGVSVMKIECISGGSPELDKITIDYDPDYNMDMDNQKILTYNFTDKQTTVDIVAGATESGFKLSMWYGDWFEYKIAVKTAGLYNVELRAAGNIYDVPPATDRVVTVSANGMSTSGVHAAVGAWDDFSITSLGKIFLDEGVNTLRVTVSGGIYTDYLTFAYDPDYNMEDQKILTYNFTDKQMTGDVVAGATESGFKLSMWYGDWFEYKIAVKTAGFYNVELRAAGNIYDVPPATDRVVTVSANGMSTYGVHSAVGAWDDFSITSLGAIFLDAGVNTLMVTVSGGIYTDYLTFVYDSNYNMDDQTIPTYTYANKQSIESNPVTGSGGRTESGYRTVAFNGDWYEYNVFVLDDGIYNASIRMAGNLNEGETGQTVTVSANGASISGTHTAVGDWSEYSVTDLGNIYLKKGLNTIRVSFMGTSYTDYLRIKLKQGSGGLPLMASVSYGKTEQEAFISIINLSDVGFNGFKVITASYDGFRLKEVYIAQKSISAGGSLEFSQGIELLGGEALKVFCWQDTDGVEPLSVQSEMTLDGSAAFLYVSPNGDDGGDGSAGAPYKTLVKAKQEAELRSASSDVAVNIAAGEYNLSAPLDFTPFGNNKIVFRGADKENTVISGGVKVSGWTDTGSGNIWKAPVTGASDVRQFYVNGKKAVRARSEGTFKGAAYYNVSEGVYVSRSVYPAIAALEGLTGAEAVCDAKWSRAYLPVDSVTPSGGSDIVKIKSPCLANAKVNFPGTSGTMTTYPFYIENALVLLDQPGEFYYDKTGRTLYYCPKADETLSASDCVAGVSEGLITINGASNNKVKNLIFENLTFAYGTWLEPASEGAIPRQSEALLTDAAGGNEASKMLPAQISVNWAENIVFKNNIIKNVGSSGIGYFEGVSSSEIIGNAFNGIGAAAVVISSFKTEGDSVRMANNCTVSNNLIRNTGTDYPSSPAISVYFAHHVNILHNDVADTSYHGISLGWCWNPNYTQSTGNVISYNKVKDVMKTVDDGAPMYTLGSQGDSRITYNHFGKSWENNKSGVGYHGGIYFDEGSSSLIVNHNVIEQAKNWFFSWDNINPSVGYGDYHYNKVTDNWADTAVYENKIYSGFDNVFQQATVAAAPNWPAGAQAVIDGAGLEATYAGLHDYLIHN